MLESLKNWRRENLHGWAWFALALAVAIPMLWAVAYALDSPVVISVQRALMLVLCVIAYIELINQSKLVPHARALLYVVSSVILARALRQVGLVMAAEPREWDFLVFYLDAKVAAQGLNLYDGENFVRVAEEIGMNPSVGFTNEILSTGFMYPPWTALLFYPLSFADIETANRVWLIGVMLCAAVLCVLLGRVLREDNIFREDNVFASRFRALDAIALAVAIVTSIHFSGLGLRHGQTVGLLSCLLVGMILQRGHWRSGVLGALCVLVKPFAVLPGVLFLLGRYWKAVISGLVTGLVILCASIVVLGVDDWVSYLTLEFATEAPAFVYYVVGNYSLLAELLRAIGYTDIPWHSQGVTLLYIACASVFAVPGLWLAARVSRKDFGVALCLLLVTTLIVYPGTIYTYMILLSVPMTVELGRQIRSGRRDWQILVFTAIAGMVLQYSLFVANVFFWIVLVRRAWLIDRASVSVSVTDRGTAV